jgi:signal transduction histidine kinase
VTAGAALAHDQAGVVAARVVASAVVITAGWVIGVAVRAQRAYTAGLREQAERRVQAQLAEQRRAVTQERLRIARELHDVVAHSLSLIAVQAGVGHYVAGARPAEAAHPLTPWPPARVTASPGCGKEPACSAGSSTPGRCPGGGSG